MNLQVIALVLAATIGFAWSQTGATGRPEFDIASVKPDNSSDGPSGGANNGQAGGHNVTLRNLIAFAWRMQEFQIYGGPGWVGSDRFDVEGKTENRKADPDQLRLMLQSLLEDRFNLKVHRETKELPIYALVIAKGGPRIKLSADQSNEVIDGPSAPGAGPNHGVIRFGAGSLFGNAVNLSLFTRFLSQRLDRTIVDKTNLKGRFDIQLQWNPDVGENPVGPGGDALPAAPADPSLPSVFAAIQEQLGLKLESARGPVEVLVIDRAGKPSGN